MGQTSTFESRIGKVNCSDQTFYSFVTDIRSFRKFIPDGAATNILLEKDSCSLNAGMLGNVTVRIAEKVPYEKVKFNGNAAQLNDFQIVVDILKPGYSTTEVKITLNAELNPLLKLVAAEPVKRLLELLVAEIEKFNGWKDITEHNQFL